MIKDRRSSFFCKCIPKPDGYKVVRWAYFYNTLKEMGVFEMKDTLEDAIQRYALPFESDADLTPLLEAIGDAKIVMLGEASHGTSEFYSVRAKLSKLLIEQKGFSSIAVEGDWPAAQHVNRYVKGYTTEQQEAREVLQAFGRWPTWMWANEEIAEFIDWLKMNNTSRSPEQRVGFYGIDYIQPMGIHR